MDINMPEMDGVEATKRIRKIFGPDLKPKLIVAHTAIPEEQFGDCHSKGFDGFMIKPIDNKLLKEYLRKVELI